MLSVKHDVNDESCWYISENKYGSREWCLIRCKDGSFRVETGDAIVRVGVDGDMVRIYSALTGGRNLKASRYLNKFKAVGMIVSCLVRFGYLD